MSSKKCDTCEYGGSNCHCFHRDSLYSGTPVDIWRSRYLKMGNSIFYIDPTAENCPGYKKEEVIMQDISRTEITKALLGVGYPISWDEELECASKRLEELWSVRPWQPAYEEREELVEAITAYEDEHVHIPPPDPITAIKFCMEHRGILPSDLSYTFGSVEKVYQILSGEQPLTDEIIFKLHTKLDIPLRSLLGHEEGITLGEFIRTEKENLERFEKWWLSLHPKDKRGYPLTQESSDDWLDEYETWGMRRG